mgnify:CR=1 FL=1
MENSKIYINGKWKNSCKEEMIDVINPSNGDIVGRVPKAGAQETKEAIDSAHDAFKEWSSLPAQKRGQILQKWAKLILENRDDIARTLTLEQGKPLSEALGEVGAAASFLEWYGEEAKRVYGEIIPASNSKKRIMVIRQAVGVVAAITPWNFPASMVTRKIAPALAVGCTVVLKPASQTPLTAIKIVELAHQAGLPRGVVNMITGPANIIGQTLMEDKRVNKITFTGSTDVGKLLMKQSAHTIKRVSLELGGHAPYIVFADADIDKAVKEVMGAKIRNCGQMCVAINRFYVHDSIMEEFLEKLRASFSQYKIGDGFEEGVHLGPLINKESYDKVNYHLEDALNKGGQVFFGGRGYHRADTEKAGYFFEPTILINVKDNMLIMKEETFGPIIPIKSFGEEEEVIRAANNTNYGLAAYVFTQDLSRSIRVSEKLEYGIIGLNDGTPSTVQAPFGGFKESGLGREGGHHGLDAFLETKYISMGI